MPVTVSGETKSLMLFFPDTDNTGIRVSVQSVNIPLGPGSALDTGSL